MLTWSRPALDSTVSYPSGFEVLSSWTKWLEQEGNHSPPTCTKVRMHGAIPPLFHTPTSLSSAKQRETKSRAVLCRRKREDLRLSHSGSITHLLLVATSMASATFVSFRPRYDFVLFLYSEFKTCTDPAMISAEFWTRERARKWRWKRR